VRDILSNFIKIMHSNVLSAFIKISLPTLPLTKLQHDVTIGRHTARCLRAAFGKVYHPIHKHRYCDRNFLVLRWKPADCPDAGSDWLYPNVRSGVSWTRLRARLAENINRQVIELGATSRNRDFLFHFPFERRKLRARRARYGSSFLTFAMAMGEQSVFLGWVWSFEGIPASGNSPRRQKLRNCSLR